MARSDIESSSYKLKSIMALRTSDSIMIDTTTIVDFQPEQVIYDTAALSEQRSNVRQIEETIEVMRLNQKLQRFRAKPDFKVRFDHMQPIGNMPSQFSAMDMIFTPEATFLGRER